MAPPIRFWFTIIKGRSAVVSCYPRISYDEHSFTQMVMQFTPKWTLSWFTKYVTFSFPFTLPLFGIKDSSTPQWEYQFCSQANNIKQSNTSFSPSTFQMMKNKFHTIRSSSHTHTHTNMSSHVVNTSIRFLFLVIRIFKSYFSLTRLYSTIRCFW